MALLNITETDRKMAVSSALVGAGAVASAAVGEWVQNQDFAKDKEGNPNFIGDNIDLTIGLAGIPVYSLARKQKGTVRDIGQALGAGMVVGGTYRFLINNTTVRDFLGLRLYAGGPPRVLVDPNEPLKLEARNLENVSRNLSGYTSSSYMAPVRGGLGAYTSSYSGTSSGGRLF